MGTLYLVATPIGNLEDITRRALRILGQVNLIAAEDTRQTRKLLNQYGLHTPLISYHEHNKLSRANEILSALAEGDVALVSDAGTPGLNDPGYELVRIVLGAGYPVSPIPGPSAPIAALVVSGLPTDAFVYLGYLPRRSSERRQLLTDVAETPYSLIFLETPHRLLNALHDLYEILGDRQVCVARELTKLYEEIFRGSLFQALEHFSEQTPRGEFTLIVAGHAPLTQRWSEEHVRAAAQEWLAKGESPSTTSSHLSEHSGWPRREIYKLITQRNTQEK